MAHHQSKDLHYYLEIAMDPADKERRSRLRRQGLRGGQYESALQQELIREGLLSVPHIPEALLRQGASHGFSNTSPQPPQPVSGGHSDYESRRPYRRSPDQAYNPRYRSRSPVRQREQPADIGQPPMQIFASFFEDQRKERERERQRQEELEMKREEKREARERERDERERQRQRQREDDRERREQREKEDAEKRAQAARDLDKREAEISRREAESRQQIRDETSEAKATARDKEQAKNMAELHDKIESLAKTASASKEEVNALRDELKKGNIKIIEELQTMRDQTTKKLDTIESNGEEALNKVSDV